MALIEAVRIQGVERPPPQSLQIRVVMEITQHGRGKPLALMFFQHIDISEMREGRMISDDTRKGYLRTLVINADAVRPGNRSLHKSLVDTGRPVAARQIAGKGVGLKPRGIVGPLLSVRKIPIIRSLTPKHTTP